MIVVDTHVVVWWTSLPERLSSPAMMQLGSADSICVPSIVFWEVALLCRRRRLALQMPVAAWAADVLSIPRVHAAPLSASIAIAADRLEMHPDPADRFIVATALEYHATLVTADLQIRALPYVNTIW